MDSRGIREIPGGRFPRAGAGGLAVLAMAAAMLSGNVYGQGTFKAAVLPTARTVQTEWKYTTADPGEDWVTADYADGDWSVGPGGFGSLGTPSAIVGTQWNTPDIWIRKTVNLADPAALNGLGLAIHHDENVQVFVNGELIFQDTGYTRDYKSVALDLEAQNAFMAGDNIIAVHCSQTIGGQFIDVGLEAVVSGTAATFLADARTEPQEWKYSLEDPGTSTWAGGGFDDASWSSAAGGFGSLGTAGAVVGKEWTTGDIWLRRTFEVGDEAYAHFFATIHHDEDVMVAINGTTVLQMSSYFTGYAELDVTASAKQAIKPGTNIIAVYCRNSDGGQYIDVGLKGVIADPPVGLKGPEGKRAVASGPLSGRRRGTVLFADLADGSLRLFGADGKRILPKR
jgi:hypothetical protein